jgi:hypothetical protein
MRLSATKLFFIAIVILSSLSGYSQKINHYQKNNLELIYFGNRYSYLMPHVVGTFDNAFDFHKAYWNYNTSTINVVLSDFSDIGYGGAITIPRNNLSIGIEPYSFAFGAH